MLFLSFRVERDGQVEVRPSFHLPARPDRPTAIRWPTWHASSLDAGGAVLHFQGCRLRGPHVDPDGPHVDFHEAMPWFDEIAAIRFLRNREVLYVHPLEESAPALELPAAEPRHSEKPMTLSWVGRHPDRDLTYLVRYSHDDGRTWRSWRPTEPGRVPIAAAHAPRRKAVPAAGRGLVRHPHFGHPEQTVPNPR